MTDPDLISPLAPKSIVSLPPIDGFSMICGAAELRYKDRDDLWILTAQPGSQIAGVFTQNSMPGAPVDWSKQALATPRPASAPLSLIVNAGNANVFTGTLGRTACETVAETTGQVFGCPPDTVFQASTGVIGQPLNGEKIATAIHEWAQDLAPNGWNRAAKAIMTTDTFPKCVTAKTEINGMPITLNGIAKGSGMIAPDMATMLVFIATDAAISQGVLQSLLSAYSALTFNAITVDSDTSTSDMVLLMASGAADHEEITNADDPALEGFKDALLSLMMELALQVIKDGEGAKKLISVTVTGAITDRSAKNIGLSIANSPLVKTAVAGEDANWGRIVMAVGKSGEPANRDTLTVSLGPHKIAENGQLSPNYQEADGATYMKNDRIDIHVDIAQGPGEFTVWTCDLTHRYIDINADYRS